MWINKAKINGSECDSIEESVRSHPVHKGRSLERFYKTDIVKEPMVNDQIRLSNMLLILGRCILIHINCWTRSLGTPEGWMHLWGLTLFIFNAEYIKLAILLFIYFLAQWLLWVSSEI